MGIGNGSSKDGLFPLFLRALLVLLLGKPKPTVQTKDIMSWWAGGSKLATSGPKAGEKRPRACDESR